jgi:hypothetical protein
MDDLEARLDALFAGPPGEFVAGRTALAKELRDAGEREEAERVAALRRPTKLAAELNRLAREEADALAAAIAAEEALAEAQAAMLGGRSSADELTAAAQAEAEAIAALSDDVAVRAAIRAAARRDDEREELRRGRLTHEPEPDLGAGLLGGQPPPPRPAPARARRARAAAEPAAEPGAVDELAARRARKAEADRESALAEARELARVAADNESRARERLGEARRRREEAERARDEAEAEATRLRAALADAERASAGRGEEAREAADAEVRAAAEAQEAARLVEEAEGVLGRLDEAGPGDAG